MWTTPRTWVDGELVSAAHLNEQLRGNFEFVRPFPLNFRFPAFSAARFTASGSMTWTVQAGDVVGEWYSLNGTEFLWTLMLSTTTIGGTLSTTLFVELPDQLQCIAPGFSAQAFSTGGVEIQGQVSTTLPTQMDLVRADLLNFASFTDSFWLYITVVGMVAR